MHCATSSEVRAKKVKHLKGVRKEANVHVRLTEDEKARIEVVATSEQRAVSAWLRKVALEALEKAERGD